MPRIRPVRSKKKGGAWKTRRIQDDCEETRSYLDGHTIIEYFVTQDGTPYLDAKKMKICGYQQPPI